MPPATGPEVPDLTPYLGTAAVLGNLDGFRAALTRPGARLSDVARDVGIDAHESFFAYLDKWPMTEGQKQVVLKRDWNGMLQLGGNIYFTSKIAATDGLSFQQIAAIMTGSTQEQYAQMMLKGGRPVAGNRSKSEWKSRG